MSKLIPLAPAFLRDTDSEGVHRRLERILRSTRFEIVDAERAFRILGPDVPYHAIDPCLADGLSRLRKDLRIEHAQSFRTHTPAFGLCLEDSWSGFFVAEWLSTVASADNIVFVHLDHHTDMMSSLLERHDDRLVDPTDGRVFDACSCADWQKGIEAGSIGIGSFVTTLFDLPNRLHVRHINDYLTSDYTEYSVVRATRSYPEIPGRTFAVIRKVRGRTDDAVGTYKGGRDPAKVLAAMPSGRVVVHVDLDYLINDFNGNSGERWAPDPDARDAASRKLDEFFDALAAASVHVDRWIVATSPGFCSAYHWAWLLESIESRIDRRDS